MDYFIGIDIGTSSARAVAFSEDGNVLAKHAVSYGISHPVAEWSEQNPAEICEAVISSINKIGILLDGNRPVLVSFSSAMHSIMAVDQHGNPLTNLIIWADNRAVAIAENLKATFTGTNFYQRSGVPIHAMSPFCKLLWMKAHRPDIMAKAYKFIGIKEFIFHALFGKYIVDTSVASATGFLNIHALQWDENILAFTGITAKHLSEPVGSNYLEYLQPAHELTARLAMFSKTAFVVGGSDGGLANLGSGAMNSNTMAITIGTSGAARTVSQQVFTDEAMRTFCYHLKDDSYITGGASSNGAIVLQWLKENMLESGEMMDAFLSHAAKVPAGCNELIFLPYILGERAPLWNSNARGVFFGLSVVHGKAHLIRAAMEAVIYNLYSIGKILTERQKVTTIYANGGFTNNPLWIQMLADMFNVTVFINDIEDSSAWGAAMVGMEALGLQVNTTQTPAGKRYEPDPATHLIYLQSFQKFERIYNLVKGEFVNAAVPDAELVKV